MILKVGATALPQNEVFVRNISKRAIIGPSGVYAGRRDQWFVQGIVRANTQSDLKTAVDARMTTFSPADYDREIGLYFNNGTSVTSDVLTHTGSTNGVVISNVTWGDAARDPGVEWVYYRKYSFVAEAEYPSASDGIVSLSESITLIGNAGPDYVIREYLTDVVDSETTKLYTKSGFRQWGAAVGLKSYPTPPSPIGTTKPFMGIQVTTSRPLKLGRKTNLNYPVRWSYYGEGPLAFTPAFP